MDLAASVLNGDRLALARTLSQVENDTLEGRNTLAALFPSTGRAHLIGVTGAPGTGKSSLVNQLARYYRLSSSEAIPCKVAIIAVDPTSPFTGGAILGDRIRMRDLAGDPGVFIRSMATRGSLGGLANATSGLVQVLDAAGFDVILIETVGVGQAEVDIVRLAHTTVVVESPGLGDDIQAIKAGILEIADILIVNKADLPGVENTERALRGMLELAHPRRCSRVPENAPLWIPPILRTVATEGTGIPEMAEAIARHRQHLTTSGEWQLRDRTRLETELENLIKGSLVQRWRGSLPSEVYEATLQEVIERRISLHQAAKNLLDHRGEA